VSAATLALFAALLAPPADPLTRTVTLGDGVGRLRLSAAEVRLSGELRLTMTVEGPAPVVVEPLPSPWAVGVDWRVTPAGPPETEPLPAGRQRWHQAFRAAPFRPGDEVPLALKPVRFRAGGSPQVRELDFAESPLPVRVRTEVLQPELKDIRPPTGVEEETPAPADRSGVAWLAVALGVLAAVAAVLGVVSWRRRRGRVPPLSPTQRALAELDRLGQSLTAAGPVPVRVLDALADAVRRYLEDRFDIAARRRTTHELLAALQAGDRLPAELLPPLQRLLERCDLAKFAGLGVTVEEGRELVRQARQLVEQTVPATPNGSPQQE
jgi:hypothetical protein